MKQKQKKIGAKILNMHLIATFHRREHDCSRKPLCRENTFNYRDDAYSVHNNFRTFKVYTFIIFYYKFIATFLLCACHFSLSLSRSFFFFFSRDFVYLFVWVFVFGFWFLVFGWSEFQHIYILYGSEVRTECNSNKSKMYLIYNKIIKNIFK